MSVNNFTNNNVRPRSWRQQDFARAGLPVYDVEDSSGIRAELRDGAGFVLVPNFTDSDGTRAASRLRRFGADFGRLLAQNAAGETLVEIADYSDEDEFDDRGYRSPGELTPHTDPPPLIVLLCIKPARLGGINRLVSAEAIREAILVENPELLSILQAGFEFFMPDEKTAGAGRVRDNMPIFIDGPGGLSCVYYRPFIERAVEVTGVPLSKKSIAALDLFDRFTTDPAFQVQYMLRPGEMLILNNCRVLHARDEYEDWPEKAERRRLLRLWLDADWLPDPPAAHAGRRNPMEQML